jgi:uncharacterized cupin superfamily protein
MVLRKGVIQSDWKLTLPESENNGRKHVVGELWDRSERPIADPEWVPGMKYEGKALPEVEKTPVLVTGNGGTEIATFTEEAGQDRHMHLVSTETYTVLTGTVRIFIDDQGPLELAAGDEVVILPGTVHEIVREIPARDEAHGSNRVPALVVRVHALRCYGDADKYVQLRQFGPWLRWKDLSKEDRKRAYKRQGGLGAG